MAENSDQIKQHIAEQRTVLTQNLNELEYRVKGAFDWRHQFQKHTALALGLAFGGGVLLGLATGSTSSRT